jgi:hypothetical protein
VHISIDVSKEVVVRETRALEDCGEPVEGSTESISVEAVFVPSVLGGLGSFGG